MVGSKAALGNENPRKGDGDALLLVLHHEQELGVGDTAVLREKWEEKEKYKEEKYEQEMWSPCQRRAYPPRPGPPPSDKVTFSLEGKYHFEFKLLFQTLTQRKIKQSNVLLWNYCILRRFGLSL